MTPDEIADYEFFVGLRGYDKDEVRHLLLTIADQQQQLLEEADALRAALAEALAHIDA